LTSLLCERGAAAAEDEERIAGIAQLHCCVKDAFVETADKAVFSRVQHKCPTTGCPCPRASGFGQEEQSRADRSRHRLRITPNMWQGAVRLLHAHAGERAHRADNI
jgi:hypothetical protein